MNVDSKLLSSLILIFNIHSIGGTILVPDPGSRDQDVILASAGLLGKPREGWVGIWNREGMGRE